MEPAIIVERVLLRNVDPPEKLKQAIQAKLEAEQEAQKMAFILEKERMEAERKRVEAKGIADAQKIIANSLSPEYLQWYYIEALRKLVDSPNNSTIILPFDQKLTPLLPIR
jgi:regulator of protease activity HflC (stomatin/prohibitin superfamily)